MSILVKKIVKKKNILNNKLHCLVWFQTRAFYNSKIVYDGQEKIDNISSNMLCFALSTKI